MNKIAAQRLNKSFDQTFSKVWPPAGPPEAKKVEKKVGSGNWRLSENS